MFVLSVVNKQPIKFIKLKKPTPKDLLHTLKGLRKLNEYVISAVTLQICFLLD